MAQILGRDPAEDRALLEDTFGHPDVDPMSPFERVEMAISRQRADRVPFDFMATQEVLSRMRDYLGVTNDEEVLRLVGIDCRVVAPDYIGPEPSHRDDGTFFDVWGSIRRPVANEYCTYFEIAEFPLAEARTPSEVEAWGGWPRTEYWDWDSVVPKVDTLNADVRYHARCEIGGIFESAWAVYGLDRFLIDLIQNPSVPCAIMDCYTDLFIENVRNLLSAAAGRIDMLYTFDDLASQRGLLMSPEMWREFIMPRHIRLNSEIKRHGLKIMYHSCGAIFPLIGAFIEELGIDVLNPLQPKAEQMDMARIKRGFGDRLAFHGAVDIQETLPRGSVADVQDEVRCRCRVLGEGGGYICASSHQLQADTPIGNIIAMYTAPRGFGLS